MYFCLNIGTWNIFILFIIYIYYLTMERKRTSKKQFNIYVDYIKSHRILVTGKLSPSNNPEDLETLWKTLTEELNACGDGPVREMNAWKKVFTEWKGLCRKKARENKLLTELEAQIIELTGQGAVTGLDLGELGIDQSACTSRASTKQPGTSHAHSSEEKEQLDVETETTETQQTPIQDSTKHKRTKLKRTRNSDILCQTYESAVNELGEKINGISLAILEVAKAINRYCDIVESSIENTVNVEQD